MADIIGHNGYEYIVEKNWGNLDPDLFPVNDCHEMVMDNERSLYLLTNETRNNILIYDKQGKLIGTWGNDYPGAHGLSISKENGTEFLFITDTERHEVIKTTLSGEVVMTLGYPKETGEYTSADQYKPTETAIDSNGDIFITDGYGLQFVIQYDHSGKYIRHWGGRNIFDCVHGIAIDNRDSEKQSLLVTSRNHNALKRFSMEGEYINTIELPGSFICRPVISGKNIYGAVFRSESNELMNSGYITILDVNDRVISTPGGSSPVYIGEKLQPQKKAGDTFLHPHDVCVDDEENLYVPQWNSGRSYPIKLTRIR